MKRSFCAVVLVLSLTGCANPYGLNLNRLDFDDEQKHGIIQFSDPKLFSREHLINERHDELNFLASAIEECKTKIITPEIIRQLEVVQSIAAGIGIKVDPAKGANFERDTELAEIKQEVVKIKAEMQLAQIRREAELLKNQLTKQKEAEKPTPPKNEVAPKVDSGVSIPAITEIDALLTRVNTIMGKLRDRIDKEVVVLKKGGGDVSPIDTFNYRKSCRDTVKNAINQTRLDELHDKSGNTLVRVQFRATVLPDEKKYEDNLGILRMEVMPPIFQDRKSRLAVQVYRSWLKYVNRNINILPKKETYLKEQRIRTTPHFLDLHQYQYFDLRYFEIPKHDETGKPISEGAKDCSGLRTEERNIADCWYLRVALPTGSADSIDIQIQTSDILYQELAGAAEGIRVLGKEANSLYKGFDIKKFNIEALDDNRRFKQRDKLERPGKTTQEAVITASRVILHRRTWRSYMEAIPHTIRRFLNVSLEAYEPSQTKLVNAANSVLKAISINDKRDPGIEVPSNFFRVIQESTHRVSAYDVGPAERVQPISTTARAAEALSMAASIAGTLPTYGLGASGNFAFLRSAVGKADALELAPIVVGFTEPVSIPEPKNSKHPLEEPETTNTVKTKSKTPASFGWLLGPKAVLNPEKQKIEFVHPIKPYELYVDLSLPSWWPHFELRAFTAWAPDWRNIDSSGTTMNLSDKRLARIVKVPMRHNSVDMAGLTMLLAQEADLPLLDAPRIDDVQPSKISACQGVIEFQIRGHNIWRASMVHIGGQSIGLENNSTDTTSIKILPDMSGILSKITLPQSLIQNNSESILTVWTSNGRDTWPIRIIKSPTTSENDCQAANIATPIEPNIQKLRPERISACAGNLILHLLGENLTRSPQISVGGLFVKKENVSALPGKKGLKFTVDVNQVPVTGNQPVTVSLSTEGGDASVQLRFSDFRKPPVLNTEQVAECVTLAELKKPKIRELRPKRVSACAGNLSFHLLGDNLTNTSQINVGGVLGTGMSTLPSKTGLSFSLDVNQVPVTGNQPVKVSLSAEGGDDSVELNFSDFRKPSVSGPSRVVECVTSAEKVRPIVESITPDSVNVCREKVSFRVRGTNLSNAKEARLGGVSGSLPVELPPHDGTLLRFEVDFKKHRRNFIELTKAIAEVRTRHGLATSEVNLVDQAKNCP